MQKTTSSTDVASSNPNSKYPLIVNVLSGDWGLQLKTSNATITVNLYFRGKDSVNVFIRDYKPALGLAILEYCCHYTIVQADDNGKVFLILMKGISCNLNEEPTSFLSTAKLENNLITMELNLEGEGVIDISGKKSTSPQNK